MTAVVYLSCWLGVVLYEDWRHGPKAAQLGARLGTFWVMGYAVAVEEIRWVWIALGLLVFASAYVPLSGLVRAVGSLALQSIRLVVRRAIACGATRGLCACDRPRGHRLLRRPHRCRECPAASSTLAAAEGWSAW